MPGRSSFCLLWANIRNSLSRASFAGRRQLQIRFGPAMRDRGNVKFEPGGSARRPTYYQRRYVPGAIMTASPQDCLLESYPALHWKAKTAGVRQQGTVKL